MALWGGMAMAQGLEGAEGIPTDLAQWFSSTASLAVVVASLLALIRKHVLRGLDGPAVVVASIALGVGLGYLGKVLGYLEGNWLFFGLSAGVMASGGVDLLRSLGRAGGGGNDKGSAPAGQDPNPGPDLDRARLR